MLQQREPKQRVRQYWLNEVREEFASYDSAEEPLYLTLPGADGFDIRLLMAEGFVAATETGAIAHEHRHRVVAVERSNSAVLKLQSAIPGLRIREADIAQLVGGASPLRWPNRPEDVHDSRARVVNLDFNSPLRVRPATDIDPPSIAMLSIIGKIAQLHASPPRIQHWTLLLTVNSQTNWNPETWAHVLEYVGENCRKVSAFRAGATALLGEGLVNRIEAEPPLNVNRLSPEAKRGLLMAYVPKRIGDLSRSQGWVVDVRRNIAYSGATGQSNMVSWIIRFRWDKRAISNPLSCHQESVATVLANVEVMA
jgi:hypothetical protein